jgi:hypothetical protein
MFSESRGRRAWHMPVRFAVVAIVGLLVVGIGAVDPGGAVGVWPPPAAAEAVEASAIPAATSQMQRIDAVTFEAGERNPQSVVTDGLFAYAGTRTSPGQVVKVRLSDMTRVGSLTLNEGENILYSAVTDGVFGYFGTDTSPGRVVKVRLSDMTRVGSVTLNEGESFLTTAVTDGVFGYFGTYTSPGQIVKVRLSDMTRVGSVTLGDVGRFLVTAVTDGVFGYFGTILVPGSVVKVRLSDLAPVDSLTLDFGTSSVTASVTDGVFGYFGTYNIPGRVVKVRLSDLSVVGLKELNVSENKLVSAISDGVFAYFGTDATPGTVVKVRLSDLERVDSVDLNPGEGEPAAGVTDGVFGYFAVDTSPGRMVKVRLSELAPQAPGQPGIPAVDVQSGSLTVTVVPSATGGAAASYDVTATPTTLGPASGSCEVVTPATSCVVSGLSTSGGYRVTVVARNAAGSSPASEPSAVVTPGAGSSTPQFDDVDPEKFFTEATSMLKLRGITTGISGTNNFRPSGRVTRAEMATFLYRMAGEPPVGACTFQDQAQIPGFARPGACWLKAEDITTNDPFNPNGLVNRAQMAAFLYRFAGKPPTGPCTFQDQAQIPSFAAPGACWLKANGITTNDPYNPVADVTRAQMAAFLYRTGGTLGYWISDNVVG